MTYRDDEAARTERANQLIDEIGELERQRMAQAETERRLEDARNELRSLQMVSLPEPPKTPVPEPERPPGLGVHVLVFSATAIAAAVGYTLLI